MELKPPIAGVEAPRVQMSEHDERRQITSAPSSKRRRGVRGGAPPWLLKASSAVLVGTLAFVMVLVILAIFGNQIPQGSRFLVVLVIALGAGFGAAGLGGHAALEGSLPIPGVDRSPVAFSAAGGIGVFVLVLLLRNQIVPTDPVPALTQDLRLLSLRGQVVNTNPTRLMIDARFKPPNLLPGQNLILGLWQTPSCSDSAAFRAHVDDPSRGNMVVFLEREKSTIVCGQLLIEEGSGKQSSAGPLVLVSW